MSFPPSSALPVHSFLLFLPCLLHTCHPTRFCHFIPACLDPTTTAAFCHLHDYIYHRRARLPRCLLRSDTTDFLLPSLLLRRMHMYTHGSCAARASSAYTLRCTTCSATSHRLKFPIPAITTTVTPPLPAHTYMGHVHAFSRHISLTWFGIPSLLPISFGCLLTFPTTATTYTTTPQPSHTHALCVLCLPTYLLLPGIWDVGSYHAFTPVLPLPVLPTYILTPACLPPHTSSFCRFTMGVYHWVDTHYHRSLFLLVFTGDGVDFVPGSYTLLPILHHHHLHLGGWVPTTTYTPATPACTPADFRLPTILPAFTLSHSCTCLYTTSSLGSSCLHTPHHLPPPGFPCLPPCHASPPPSVFV